MQKYHNLNNFTYFCEKENYFGNWIHHWHFKPTEAQIWVHFTSERKVLKKDMEALLGNPSEAQAYYDAAIAREADIPAAQAALSQAIAKCSQTDNPNFDPGGRRNNPGAVSRALKEKAGSLDAIAIAERRLLKAYETTQILAKGNRASS